MCMCVRELTYICMCSILATSDRHPSQRCLQLLVSQENALHFMKQIEASLTSVFMFVRLNQPLGKGRRGIVSTVQNSCEQFDLILSYDWGLWNTRNHFLQLYGALNIMRCFDYTVGNPVWKANQLTTLLTLVFKCIFLMIDLGLPVISSPLLSSEYIEKSLEVFPSR